MYYVVIVKVFDGGEYLTGEKFDLIILDFTAFMLLDEGGESSTLQVLHEYAALGLLNLRIVVSRKVHVLNNVGMIQVLRNHEFLQHLISDFIGHFLVIYDLWRPLHNHLLWQSLHLTKVDLALRTGTEWLRTIFRYL